MDSTNKLVSLGFAETTDSWRLRSVYFPSKIGGFPAWLNPEHLLPCDELLCDHCRNPTIFLCQIYAPVDKETCFHRTLYIFLCLNPSCHSKPTPGCFKVFRCQLPRNNKYYSSEPPDEDKEIPDINPYRKYCKVNNIFDFFYK